MKYYRGDTVGMKFTLRNKRTLQPIDLTGKTCVFTVNESENPGDASGQLLQISTTGEVPLTDGVVIFTPPDANATDFAVGNYFFDIQISNTSDGSEKQTIVKDDFELAQDITKS